MAHKNKFDGGELDKRTLGAADDPVYRRGAARLENFSLLENGGINRRRGYERIREILKNTEDKAVKLIPVSEDGETDCLLYVSKSRYGYIRFKGHEAVERGEKDAPAPFAAGEAQTVPHKERDPDAYYEITDTAGELYTEDIFTGDNTGTPDIHEGEELELAADSEIERARIRIESESVSAKGKLKKAEEFFVKPDPVMEDMTLTQERTRTAPDPDQPGLTVSYPVSYFDEYGSGQGLKVSVTVGAADDNRICRVKTAVVDGGTGYYAIPGKDYTFIRYRVEELDQTFILKALVSGYGTVMSVEDTEVEGAADLPKNGQEGDEFRVRYYAPEIPPGPDPDDSDSAWAEIYDYADRSASVPARVRIHSEEADGPTNDKYYNYTFEIKDGGAGYIDSFGGMTAKYILK
jgi:hypothetical protein